MNRSDHASEGEPRKVKARLLWASDIPPKWVEYIKSLSSGRSKDECWPWERSVNRRGYGIFSARLKIVTSISAHRAAFALANGSAPGDFLIRHTCDNPPCCNPSHLIIGTHLDNTHDMLDRNRGKWAKLNQDERIQQTQHFARGTNKTSRRVIGPDGKIRSSAREVDDELGLTKGTTWRRCNDGDSEWSFIDAKNEYSKRQTKWSKKVISPEGKEWNSGSEAAKELGEKLLTVLQWCRRGTRGWRFA